MTDFLDDLERVLAAATPGEWRVEKCDSADSDGVGGYAIKACGPAVTLGDNGWDWVAELILDSRDAEAIVALRNNADTILGLLREARVLLAYESSWEGFASRRRAWLARLAQEDEEG